MAKDEKDRGDKRQGERESPDPGYRAFAEAPDDPLAEWPSPDAVLEELPEMRGRGRTGREPGRAAKTADEEVESLAADADEDFVDDFLNDLDDGDYSENDYSGARYSENDYNEKDRDENDYGEDREAPAEDTPASGSAFANTMRDASATLAREITDFKDTRVMHANPDTPSTQALAEAGAGHSAGPPLGMIALVVLTLILLGAGGYGVIQQLSAMQAEIRELQAQLATAVSADKAAIKRERQRQLEFENETLRSELEALQIENAALSEQLSRRPAQPARQPANNETATLEANAERDDAARETERQVAPRPREEAAEAPAPANAPAPAAAAPWFVNFGSYAQRRVANQWADRLDVDEGKIVVQTISASDKTLYRVRVVDLATQDAAERVAIALERAHDLPRLWVGR